MRVVAETSPAWDSICCTLLSHSHEGETAAGLARGLAPPVRTTDAGGLHVLGRDFLPRRVLSQPPPPSEQVEEAVQRVGVRAAGVLRHHGHVDHVRRPLADDGVNLPDAARQRRPLHRLLLRPLPQAEVSAACTPSLGHPPREQHSGTVDTRLRADWQSAHARRGQRERMGKEGARETGGE
eukprot:5743179-Pleurochrysis_carterae.AAC.2